MSTKSLLRRFDAWRGEDRPLVLATVVGSEGSTYSKAGQRMLISDAGECEGLVSGGCLEGDLAVHAGDVLQSGQARVVTYDLRGDAGDPFGLGVGCDGLLRILLQRLTPADHYEPLATIAAIMRGERASRCHIFLTTNARQVAGTTLFGIGDWFDDDTFTGAEVLHTTIQPLPRLLVLGAGADAVPIVTLADTLGWRVTLVDHRPAYLERPGFAAADSRLCMPAATLAANVELPRYAAAIVMNHHLDTDRSHLGTLAASPIPYIGLLGPPGRRDRLLRELGTAGSALGTRLHGPAGLDIGADSPESIAVAILAEIHAKVLVR